MKRPIPSNRKAPQVNHAQFTTRPREPETRPNPSNLQIQALLKEGGWKILGKSSREPRERLTVCSRESDSMLFEFGICCGDRVKWRVWKDGQTPPSLQRGLSRQQVTSTLKPILL